MNPIVRNATHRMTAGLGIALAFAGALVASADPAYAQDERRRLSSRDMEIGVDPRSAAAVEAEKKRLESIEFLKQLLAGDVEGVVAGVSPVFAATTGFFSVAAVEGVSVMFVAVAVAVGVGVMTLGSAGVGGRSIVIVSLGGGAAEIAGVVTGVGATMVAMVFGGVGVGGGSGGVRKRHATPPRRTIAARPHIQPRFGSSGATEARVSARG
jgi:hypothetical protein